MGIITLIATFISNNKQLKLQTKIQNVDLLNVKRNKLEKILEEISTIAPSLNVDQSGKHALEKLIDLLKTNRHYLHDIEIDNKISELSDLKSEIYYLLNFGDEGDLETLEILYNKTWNLSQETFESIQNILNKVIKKLEREVNI